MAQGDFTCSMCGQSFSAKELLDQHNTKSHAVGSLGGKVGKSGDVGVEYGKPGEDIGKKPEKP